MTIQVRNNQEGAHLINASICFVAFLSAALLVLQWREGGAQDISWFLWFLFLQFLIIIWELASSWTKGANGAYRRSPYVALLLTIVSSGISILPGALVSTHDFLIIEAFVLLNFAVVAFSFGRLSKMNWLGTVLFFLAAAGVFALLFRSLSALMYVTPFPGVTEILSWSLSVGKQSAQPILFLGREFSRLNFSIFVQLIFAAAAFLFTASAASFAKGLLQGKR